VATRRLITCAVLVASLLAACGGDEGLSAEEKLRAAQDDADIKEYCAPKPPNLDLLDDLLFAVDDLVKIYREHPDESLAIPPKKKQLTVRQLMAREASELEGCGRYGRAQAAKIRRILEA
jgi:hypothetical protein